MNTKIVIQGKPGCAINGSNILLEVDGVVVDGQCEIQINADIGEVASATVRLILPEIEYRESIE
tara:strand:+ start:271 stop:462 length:192 start_codon:yes stop_codon:yes gene_type:complete